MESMLVTIGGLILGSIAIPMAYYFVNGIIKRMHSQSVLEIQRDNNISRNMSISNASSTNKIADISSEK